MHLGGGNSELMLAWAIGCALIPDGVSFEAAAPHVLRRLHGDERPAQRRAPAGRARGGPRGGRARPPGAAVSKAVGLETLAITGQADKKAELRALGADEVVLAGDDPGKALQRRRWRRRHPVDDQLGQHRVGLQRPSPGGRFINMGVPDGPIAHRPDGADVRPARAARQHAGRARRSFEALNLVAAARSNRRSSSIRSRAPTRPASAWQPARSATGQSCSTRRGDLCSLAGRLCGDLREAPCKLRK